MRMRAFFSTSAQTDVAFISPPPKLEDVAESALWNQSYHDVSFSQIMRMRAFFSTSAQTDDAFIFPQDWNTSLNFLCEISHIMMPNFLKSCAWEPSSVLQLKRMLPSFSSKIGTCRWISFVKSIIPWCFIFSNHAHESLLQQFSSNGCCLHFPPKLEHVAEFPLQNQSCHNA